MLTRDLFYLSHNDKKETVTRGQRATVSFLLGEGKMKIKRKIISILLSIILFVNVPLLGITKVYAEDAVSMNPLFIPISTLVATVAVGSGIIAKNSSEALQAGNELINNVINNIKNTEIARKKEDSNYVSPYKVINGQGQPEEPNDNNKNGKWVALGGGAIASGEIWANKDLVSDIMRGVYDLKGYEKYVSQTGIISANDLFNQSSASNVALQLANISNSSVKQFDDFLHCDWWNGKDFTPDDAFFAVQVDVSYILRQTPMAPEIYVMVTKKSDLIKNVKLLKNQFSYYTYSNSFGSLSYYYTVGYDTSYYPILLDENNTEVSCKYYIVRCPAHDISSSFRYKQDQTGNRAQYNNSYTSASSYAYSGYKWITENVWDLTNNVYNVNQNFDVNFPDWLQDSINLLNQNIEAVRLGIQSLNDPWNNTQTEVQTGTSPSNVINQYINYYENPENIPEPEPEPNPEPEPEPDSEPATEAMVDEASQSLFDWALNKIQLPDGFWEKLPFSIPYDMYLLIKAVLPSRSSGRRKMLKASFNSPDSANGITISSYYDASGATLRGNNAVLEVPAKWSSNAPVINWDLHFKYTGVDGTQKQLDYVKTVDLGQYAYFAMIIYIAVYVAWMGAILGFIFDSFK